MQDSTFTQRLTAWIAGGVILCAARLPLVAAKGLSNLAAQNTEQAATVTQPAVAPIWDCVLISSDRSVCYVWLHIPSQRFFKLNPATGRHYEVANPLP